MPSQSSLQACSKTIFDQIERDQHGSVAMTLAADKLEHGKSVIVSYDSLAIDQE